MSSKPRMAVISTKGKELFTKGGQHTAFCRGIDEKYSKRVEKLVKDLRNDGAAWRDIQPYLSNNIMLARVFLSLKEGINES